MSIWPKQNLSPLEGPSSGVGNLPVAPNAQPPRSRWRGVLLFVAAIALVAGAGFVVWSKIGKPVLVQTAASVANVREQVFGLGTVGARVVSNVGFKVSGVLVDLATDQGDHIRAGATIARLDARDVEAQLAAAKAGVTQAEANIVKARADVASAQANLANAQSVSGRRADLVRSGFASVEEAQTTDAATRVARANVDVASSEIAVGNAALEAAHALVAFTQATLDNYTLRAPYDALVVARNINLGSMPVPGQAVFNLVEPQTIWVQGYVDERLAGALTLGQPAEIILRSHQGERLVGHVARIEIQSDAVNEERLVDVAFDAIPADIHLAEQAEVFIQTGTLSRAVLVPQSAVSGLANGQGMVWTVEHGALAQRRVSFGPMLVDGTLPITGGLPDDVRVVIAPTTGLHAGRAATISEGQAK